jgi:hypothetical protein
LPIYIGAVAGVVSIAALAGVLIFFSPLATRYIGMTHQLPMAKLKGALPGRKTDIMLPATGKHWPFDHSCFDILVPHFCAPRLIRSKKSSM